MDNSDPEGMELNRIMVGELKADMAKRDYTVTALAVALDKNYHSLRRYFKPEKYHQIIPMPVVYASLRVLGVGLDDFFMRVTEQLPKE